MNKSVSVLFISLLMPCFLTACGKTPQAVTEFSLPEEYETMQTDICMSRNDKIYISVRDSILEYSAAGEESQVIELPDRQVFTVAASDEMLYTYDELNGSILELGQDGSILRQISPASAIHNTAKILASEDTLYLLCENGANEEGLLSVSLPDRTESFAPVPDLHDIGLYDGDLLLVRIKTAFYLYDPDTQETELYYPARHFGGGYSYDPQEKLLYYIANNTLYCMEEKNQEQSVVKILNRPYSKIAFLAGNIVMFDPDGKYVCALNPKTYTEETASVRTYNFETYSYYAEDYTENTGVKVVDVLGSVDEKFLRQLLAGDNKADIFVLYSSDIHSLEFLTNHAYTDLSVSETLVNTVDQMHRSLRDSAYQGNELTGIPLRVSGAVMALNTESEAYSLAADRITDWDSLLLLLEELPPGSTILANQAGMYQRLFEQYLYEYCKPYEGKADFDTEAFRKVLNLITRIHDCSDFQKPGTGPGSAIIGYYSDRDFRQTDVLGINSGLDPGSIVSPHKLPDLEETRSLAPQISVAYAVVNPNSENKEGAIRYLEALVTGEKFSSLPEIFPLSDNEDLNLYMDEAHVPFEQGVLNNVVSILYSYADGKLTQEETIAAIQEKADLILAE